MSATDRGKNTVYGHGGKKEEQHAPPSSSIVTYQYACNISDRPTDIVLYLIAVQVRVFDRSILDKVNQRALTRHAKQLLQRHTAKEICMAIVDAANVAEHPFSFKFVEERINGGVR